MIMIKNLLTAMLALAVMFAITNQGEMFGHHIEDNTQCPYFNKSGFTGWDDLHRWCPPFLAKAMKQICRGKYNNPPEMSARKKRLIMDECCQHCCSARFLKFSYCNDSRADNRKLFVPPIENEDSKIYELY